MNAAQILAIADAEPERLFSKDRLKDERIALLKQWHPDRNKDHQASAVFAHIQKLYDTAVERLAKGHWRTPGLLELQGVGGKRYEIRYLREHALDLGAMYVGRTAVTFLIERRHKDLFDHATARINAISYPAPQVREEISRYMPEIIATFETGDKLGLVMRKTEDVLLLKDVHDHFGGRMDPRHVAWIVSRLFNLASYGQVSGQVFPAMAPESVFISPPHHSAVLLGGWWFAHGNGEALKALPAKSLAFMPKRLLKDKRACIRMAGESIKATARELLGDIHGSSLRMNKDIPTAMVDWLNEPAGDDAIKDYEIWRDTVLKSSFGERRFVKLGLSASDIYT